MPSARAPRASCRTSRRARRSRSSRSTALLKDIRAGKGTVGKLFTDDELYREINEFVDSAQVVAASLSDGKGTLGMLIKDPAAYNALERGARRPAGDDPPDQRRARAASASC